MAENDVQIELKKRARRRLVGAAALALGAAIFLPMVMDKEPRRVAGDLQIRIPSQEGDNFTARPINVPPAASIPPAVAEPVITASAPVSTQPALEPVAPAPSVSAPVATSPSAPIVDRREASPPGSKPDEAQRALAILEGRPAVRPADAASRPASTPAVQKYFVQLGVYREAENVRSVQTRLKAAGFTAVTEKVGDRTRVRVGPYATRAAADAAVAKLKKAGLSAVVAAR